MLTAAILARWTHTKMQAERHSAINALTLHHELAKSGRSTPRIAYQIVVAFVLVISHLTAPVRPSAITKLALPSGRFQPVKDIGAPRQLRLTS
jgi:hypothetical protein